MQIDPGDGVPAGVVQSRDPREAETDEADETLVVKER